MFRLTSRRVNGIKEGYWSPAKKEELVQRLGKFEDIGYEPEVLQVIARQYEKMMHEKCKKEKHSKKL